MRQTAGITTIGPERYPLLLSGSRLRQRDYSQNHYEDP
jgi:hypothetical protein